MPALQGVTGLENINRSFKKLENHISGFETLHKRVSEIEDEMVDVIKLAHQEANRYRKKINHLIKMEERLIAIEKRLNFKENCDEDETESVC